MFPEPWSVDIAVCGPFRTLELGEVSPGPRVRTLL